jgi:hypothetical protein
LDNGKINIEVFDVHALLGYSYKPYILSHAANNTKNVRIFYCHPSQVT